MRDKIQWWMLIPGLNIIIFIGIICLLIYIGGKIAKEINELD